MRKVNKKEAIKCRCELNENLKLPEPVRDPEGRDQVEEQIQQKISRIPYFNLIREKKSKPNSISLIGKLVIKQFIR